MVSPMVAGTLKFFSIMWWWPLLMIIDKNFFVYLGKTSIFPVVGGKLFIDTLSLGSWLYIVEPIFVCYVCAFCALWLMYLLQNIFHSVSVRLSMMPDLLKVWFLIENIWCQCRNMTTWSMYVRNNVDCWLSTRGWSVTSLYLRKFITEIIAWSWYRCCPFV